MFGKCCMSLRGTWLFESWRQFDSAHAACWWDLPLTLFRNNPEKVREKMNKKKRFWKVCMLELSIVVLVVIFVVSLVIYIGGSAMVDNDLRIKVIDVQLNQVRELAIRGDEEYKTALEAALAEACLIHRDISLEATKIQYVGMINVVESRILTAIEKYEQGDLESSHVIFNGLEDRLSELYELGFRMRLAGFVRSGFGERVRIDLPEDVPK
ncbi:hypothetical protein A3K73_02140 [Candidatus Pacearchaeota archaeon RBG_13_36_9]|nr:MAG: hypothetical protein A3K73_02140 [Candidatus Pacearchaeota archaeon RBG_13_36_9]